MTLGENIRRIRISRQMTQADLARLLGVTDKAISTWENNTREPNMGMIQKMSEVWGIKKSFIIDGMPDNNEGYTTRIPILGKVVAGVPVEAIEEIEGWEELDRRKFPVGSYYALRIKGRSMEPKLLEGDLVIVRVQEDVDSGDVAIVLVNGNDATCKQIKKFPSGIMLIGFNTAEFTPIFYSNEDIELLPVRISGKVVESRRPW